MHPWPACKPKVTSRPGTPPPGLIFWAIAYTGGFLSISMPGDAMPPPR